uniref:VCBS repeat-containing protein n=1 Tax=Polaribacter sp. TaxID=1920175 RepID=UPI004047F010
MKTKLLYLLSGVLILLFLITCSKPDPIIEFTLTINISPSGGGTISPSEGAYPSKTNISILATPSDEYIFKEWNGGVTGTTNPISVTMSSNKNITGVFEKRKSTGDLLTGHSELNKKTSWYITNSSFDELFDVKKSEYWGFEILSSGELQPFPEGTFSNNKDYYWNDIGTYLYTDLNGDGYKDLWAYYLKSPWPTNKKGLHLFSEYQLNSNSYDVQIGLTQVRKVVLSDLDNDNTNEIILFSSGYDSNPFPGDSIGIFDVQSKTYKYLSNDIGYFHGGAVGDVNNDGFNDILGYSGGSAVIPVHPAIYLNKGNGSFELKNDLFIGFSNQENYYTVELFDINDDGKLDLFLGSSNKLHIIEQSNGVFDFSKKMVLPIPSGDEVMDIGFFDFDNDGKEDIITMDNTNGYSGYSLNLYIKENGTYVNKTRSYFDFTDGSGQNTWAKWLRLFDYDKDGDIDIVADGLFGDLLDQKLYWRNDDGIFKRVITN